MLIAEYLIKTLHLIVLPLRGVSLSGNDPTTMRAAWSPSPLTTQSVDVGRYTVANTQQYCQQYRAPRRRKP